MFHTDKKIFIVSSYAPPSIGGPQTFYNLLCQLSPESYSMLTSFFAIDKRSAQEGTWLQGPYFFYDNPKGKREDLVEQKNNQGSTAFVHRAIQKLKFTMKRIPIIREIFGIPVIIWQIFVIFNQGKKVLKKNPHHVILAVSDYGPALIGAYYLHKKTKLPLTLFLFDIYKGNAFPFPGGLLSRIFEKKILSAATTVIVNNQGTQDFYKERYGSEMSKKFRIIYNSVFPEHYTQLEKHIKKPEDCYEILYTGRVNWPQLRSLKNLIKSIEELDDAHIKLSIYSPSPKDYLEQLGILESKYVHIDFAAPQDIPKIQNKADILFIPLSWETASPDIINTATPAKLTDYLIAGKPILIHAPATSFLVKYAQKNNFAEVVDTESTEALKQALQKIITNKVDSLAMVESAREVFHKNHDAHKNIKLFVDIFKSS